MADTHVKVGSAWKALVKGGSTAVKVSGAWKTVEAIYVKVSGAWKLAWQNLDLTLLLSNPISISKTKPTTGTGYSGMRFDNSGQFMTWGSSPTTSPPAGSTNYFLPAASHNLITTSDFEVRLVRLDALTGSGSYDMNDFAVVGTWYDLNNQDLRIQQVGVGTTTGTGRVAIREKANPSTNIQEVEFTITAIVELGT